MLNARCFIQSAHVGLELVIKGRAGHWMSRSIKHQVPRKALSSHSCAINVCKKDIGKCYHRTALAHLNNTRIQIEKQHVSLFVM
jgi:hypothetical protein